MNPAEIVTYARDNGFISSTADTYGFLGFLAGSEAVVPTTDRRNIDVENDVLDLLSEYRNAQNSSAANIEWI